MKLTSRGRYAVTSILDLAFHSAQGPVSLAHISKRQDISLSYLEQLFTCLRRYELVQSTRGPGGGYSLSRPAGEIAIADVIAAVDEQVDARRCSGSENCHAGQQCLAHDLWDELNQQIFGFLREISLQDLLDDESIRSVALRQDERTGYVPDNALSLAGEDNSN